MQSTTASMEEAFWKLEKGAAPFLGSLEQPASVDTDPPLPGGCSHCGASSLATGRHISSLTLCIFLNGLPLTLVYSLGLLFCKIPTSS